MGADRGRRHRRRDRDGGELLGPVAWWLDLLTHFPVQYAVVLLLLALGYSVMRKTRLAWGFFALSAINVALVVPLYLGGETCRTLERPAYRAVSANVSARSATPSR